MSSNLIELTKLFIQQNYSPKDLIFANRQSYEYFRNYALKNRRMPQKKINTPLRQPPIPPLAPTINEMKKPVEKPQIEQKKPIALQTKQLVNTPSTNFQDIRQFFQKNFTNIVLPDDIPKNSEGKTYAVAIVSSDSNPAAINFLEKLQKAIDEHLAPASIMQQSEFDSKKGNFTLVLKSKDLVLEDSSIKTISLEHYSEYIENRTLKTILWNELKKSLL